MATEGDSTRSTGDRYTVPEAADQLGISVEAVRQRLKRGTLRHEKREGRVYILLDADRTRPTNDQPNDRSDEYSALTSQMQARIDSLEHQLEQEREANRENRRLLAAALERIPPQLEASYEEAPGASETPTQEASGGGVREEQQRPPTRPLWRRVFGR